jgi:hypothetical protein
LEVLSERANGTFATEPHEAGWADEALAIAYVREASGPAPRLMLRAQISADGARWIDHPVATMEIAGAGNGTIALTHFGNWLRLAGEVSGGPPDGTTAVVIDLYWVLKG